MVRSEGNMSLKNPVTTLGIDPGTVRLVAQRLNHYATPGPKIKYLSERKYLRGVDEGMNRAFNFQINSSASCLLHVTDIDTLCT